MAWLRFLTIVFGLALSFVVGCNSPLQVEVAIPPRRFGISGRVLPVPPELQRESRIALLPCTVLPCPDLESWVLECVHEICDPGPREIVLES
ncbi:MAG: hypothetical protein RMJ84_13670, partial [Sandaracinaceae bacterium]|nr:hypothetical protein [Sandaracinaceae bacterium]